MRYRTVRIAYIIGAVITAANRCYNPCVGGTAFRSWIVIQVVRAGAVCIANVVCTPIAIIAVGIGYAIDIDSYRSSI